MEILYRVDKLTFKDRESAERYEQELKDSLVAKANAYKRIYMPIASRNYRKSLERLRNARGYFRIKNLTQICELHIAHEEWLEKKRILRDRIAEYKNARALIKQLSTDENTQNNKKKESKK